MTFREISLSLSLVLGGVIMVVIGAVYYSVAPVVRRVEVEARETGLRNALDQMRGAIKTYAAERRQLPNTLDDLVEAKLLTRVPLNPITETRNWRVIKGTRLNGLESAPGIVDVRCESSATSSKGTLYSDW